jgi:hypothetical protein
VYVWLRCPRPQPLAGGLLAAGYSTVGTGSIALELESSTT